MAYDVPGRADVLDEAMVDRWNETVAGEYRRLFAEHGSRFITADPASLPEPEPRDVHWFADPAEAVTCLDQVSARKLADWRPRGRTSVHDEYAEYAIEVRADAEGRTRPKRVQVTTELREYWLAMATGDPDVLATIAGDVLGRRPSFRALYGVDDPWALTETQRASHFVRQTAGDDDGPPEGELNTANALFMTHPINGLDDLLYIVMFGARPYTVLRPDGSRRAATLDEVFSLDQRRRILACRHADPAAALAAQRAAMQGRTIALADPLGMHITSFNDAALTINGGRLPGGWVRWGRGEQGLRQRLVVGPPDDDERFLDDITVSVGAADEPLVGGFQLLQLIEVGPRVIVGPPSPLAEGERVDVPSINTPIDCSASWACKDIRSLKALFDRDQATRRTGRRSPGAPDA